MGNSSLIAECNLTVAKNISENVTVHCSANVTKMEDLQPDAFPVVVHGLLIAEIVMTLFELTLPVIVAIMYVRWRRNYRNQMLMQLSFVRVLKRIVMYIVFLRENDKDAVALHWEALLSWSQIYIDFVIVLLVAFFIKYMYDSLIIVIVKRTPNNLIRMVACAWLVPVPIAAVLTLIEMSYLDHWHLYLLVCCIFRWPLIAIGTQTYITVLFKVLMDKGRKSLRGLAAITFLLCVTINLYLFCRDIIELWCKKSAYTVLVGVLGLMFNVLALFLYVYLIAESTKRVSRKRYSVEAPYVSQYKYPSGDLLCPTN